MELELRAETVSAVAAVRAGLPIVRARQGADDVRQKGPGDLVTGSDVLVEATIQHLLGERHPEIAFVGEEGGQQVPSSGRWWMVDPLCGTSNYAAGVPLFSINVALVDSAGVALAAIGDGFSGEVYVAERGLGAWRLDADGPHRMQVRASNLVAVDPTMPAPRKLGEVARALSMAVVGAGRWNVRMFGSTLVMPYVAAGRIAGCAFASGGITVHNAAGLLLVREAGARVCDERGEDWTADSSAMVIAASAELQRDLLEIVRAVLR